MDVDLDLGCVLGFVFLLEERHFGRAAARLHLTASALTKRIQRLENQLGAVLIERGPSGTADVTEEGARFLGHARPLLAEARAARDSVRSRDPQPFTVRLGVPGVIGEFPDRSELALLARELRERVPDARLRCYGLPFRAVVSALIDHHVDVIWTASRADDVAIESVPMAAMRRIAVVPSTHELAESRSARVDRVIDLPILYDPSAPPRWMAQWYLGDIRPSSDARLVEISAPDVMTVLSLVAAGVGVAIAPRPLARRLAPGLRALALTDAPPLVFHALRHRTDHREPVVALVNCLRRMAERSMRGEDDPSARSGAPSGLTGKTASVR